MAPSPQPQPLPEAREIAAGLADIYGQHALASARAALQLAHNTGVAEHVALWRGVLAILQAEARTQLLIIQ